MKLSVDDLGAVARNFRDVGPSTRVAKPAPVFRAGQGPSTPVHDVKWGADETPPDRVDWSIFDDMGGTVLPIREAKPTQTGKPSKRTPRLQVVDRHAGDGFDGGVTRRPDVGYEAPEGEAKTVEARLVVPKPAPRRPMPAKKAKQLRRRRYSRPEGDGYSGGIVAPSRQLGLTTDDLVSLVALPKVDPLAVLDTIKVEDRENPKVEKVKIEVEPIWDATPARKKTKQPDADQAYSSIEPSITVPKNAVNRASGLTVLKSRSKPKPATDDKPTFSSLANTLVSSVMLEEPPEPPPFRGR